MNGRKPTGSSSPADINSFCSAREEEAKAPPLAGFNFVLRFALLVRSWSSKEQGGQTVFSLSC